MSGFEEWGGYMAAKKQKLVSQFEKSKATEINREEAVSNIFNGISIYVNGYTNPTSDELKRLMMLHGGEYHHYYSITRTTHMVATNLPHGKKKALKNQKVVTPDWITDSIKAGKLLPYQNYVLYTPEATFQQHRLQVKPESHDMELFPRAPEVENDFFPVADNNMDSSCVDMLLQPTTTTGINLLLQHNNELNPAPSVPQSTVMPMSSKEETSPVENVNSRDAIKAGDPNFISEFYSHSRLHHLSTSAQDFKQYVQQLAARQKGKPFPGRELLMFSKPCNAPPLFKNEKVIMHLDMDCFFVSVGLRKYPELRGHPVAVTHSKGGQVKRHESSNLEYEAQQYRKRLKVSPLSGDVDEDSNKSSHTDFGSMSEIACCNYVARESGLWNGMYLGEALKLCPGLKTIPYDFEAYSEVTKQLYDIVASFTLDLEAVSCDELYINCTELLNSTKVSSSDFTDYLRAQIYVQTNCTASAGIGGNMLLARLASRRAKPNGQYIVHEADVIEFMQDQLIKDLPGVGYSTRPKLEQFCVHSCHDLQKWPITKLQKEFGVKKGQTLYEFCRGKDERVVTLEKDRKSVSAEINYGMRFKVEKEIYDFLSELAVEVHKRLNSISKKGRSITLKLRVRREDAPQETAKFMGHGICDSLSKSTLLKTATDDVKLITTEVCNIARSLKIPPQDYRGIGIQITKLESVATNVKSGSTLDSFLAKPSTSFEEVPRLSIQETTPAAKPKPVSTSIKTGQISDNILVNPGISSKVFAKKSEPVAILDNRLPSSNIVSALSKSSTNNLINIAPASGSSSTMPYGNISIEQFDQSVLNALPEELRQEVYQVYGVNSNAPAKKPVTLNRPPAKKQVQSKIHNIATSKLTKSSIASYCVKNSEKIINNSEKMVIPISENSEDDSSSQANLAGSVDIDEVRDLLKEWVASTQNPDDGDIKHFKDYLLKLIEEDLEKVDLVLKYFYRLAGNATELWREAYLLSLSYVQQKMLQNFGYMLKARSSFEL